MELKNKDGKKIMPEAKPIIPTAIIAIYVLIYAAYSLMTWDQNQGAQLETATFTVGWNANVFGE